MVSFIKNQLSILGLKLDFYKYYKWDDQPKYKFPLFVWKTFWGLEFFRFIFIGGLTVPIGLGLLWFCTEIVGVHYLLSNAIAFIVSTICWYFMQSKWTFNHTLDWRINLPKSLIIRLIVLGINEGVLALLVGFLTWWYIPSAIVAMLCGFPVGYILGRRLIWNQR